jgi:hypothetical protein
MSNKFVALMAAAALALASSAAFAASSAWLRVIVIKTDSLAAYTHELDRGRAMLKRLGIPAQIRVWRATYAGADAGAVVVTVEYPSWAAFAEGQSKSQADKDFAAWQAGLDKLRTITSDSIYREL